MSNLYVEETYLNATEEYIFGESGVYETYTNSRGDLFRDMQKEYGGCVGKSYVDTDSGVKVIGWVFQKYVAYEDDPTKRYLREVWVTIHTEMPTRTVEFHYA